MYEIAYVNNEKEIRSKLYEQRDAFLKDYQIIKKSGKPMMGQGPNKNTGKIVSTTENGWSDDDVILTAEVKFSSGTEYSYSAGKHYSGLYEVKTSIGGAIVSVNYRWRLLDEFRASMWTLGYDEPTRFESIMIRKVK